MHLDRIRGSFGLRMALGIKFNCTIDLYDSHGLDMRVKTWQVRVANIKAFDTVSLLHHVGINLVNLKHEESSIRSGLPSMASPQFSLLKTGEIPRSLKMARNFSVIAKTYMSSSAACVFINSVRASSHVSTSFFAAIQLLCILPGHTCFGIAVRKNHKSRQETGFLTL